MKRAWLLFCVLVLGGCGGQDAAVSPQSGPGSARLILFAAPNCEWCNKEIPTLQQRLREVLSTRYGQLSVVVYVENGTQPNKRPDDAVVQAYKASFPGTDFQFAADPWQHTIYKSYYPNAEQATLPAAVIVSGSGSTNALTPGSYSPDTLATDVATQFN